MERVAFVGFGEAGQTISHGLPSPGVGRTCASDILVDSPQGQARHAAARQLGVAEARDHRAAVGEADIVFLAVTASASLEAATSCLPGLRKGQLFLDINSVSP